MPRRHGFTLIELLVVIAVIATLAGLLIPTIGIVRRMANDIKCGNQLQQIAGAIEVYKTENDEAFPSHMIGGPGTTATSTDDLVHSGGPLTGTAKIFLCPRDSQAGADHLMGRTAASGMGDLSGLYDSGPIHGQTVGSSYDYEASGYYVGDANAGSLDWFYTSTDITQLATDGIRPTWAIAKHNELVSGAPDTSGSVYSGPFPATQFPIIRCFWHNQWNTRNIHTDHKVKNVSWDLNVFDSIPKWEAQVDPANFAP
jgi:prepilin-type N-terminal cleavage/methylation domain-containing protein